MLYGEPVAHRGAVVEDVQGVAAQADRLDEPADHPREVVEGVVELAAGRRDGVAEAGEVGGGDAVAVREQRDQVAEHVRRGGEAVEQQDRGVPRLTRLAVKHAVAARVGPAVVDHAMPLSRFVPSQTTTTIFPLAWFASITRCASRISSNRNTRDGFAW